MKSRQTGVGLVELMISLVLGLLIMALALQMFLGSRASQSSQQALSYLQESARYVSFRLQPLMRNIGYAGCSGAEGIENIDEENNVIRQYDLRHPISAKKAKHNGIDYWELDWIYADKESEAPLAAGMATGASDLEFSANDIGVFLNGDNGVVEKVAIINDCNTADIFELADSEVSGNRIETKNDLSHAYGQSGSATSYVYPVKAWRLLLGEQAGSKTTALFIDRVESRTLFQREELVAGVSGLDIRFGVDTNDDGSIDQPEASPDAVDKKSRIRRVEIALTLQSEPGVVPGGHNNGRLERTFNMTFAPRNLQLRGDK